MSVCKQCKGEVKWVKTDRWYCRNPDGTDHWDLCAQLKTANFLLHGKAITRNKGKDTGLKVPQEWGIEKPNGKVKTEMMLQKIGRTITGANYKPNGCDCGLPPWELCKPDCEHRIGG